MQLDKVIIKPKITEKAMAKAKGVVYAFEVAHNAGKYQIGNTIEKLFNVKVAHVRTIVRKGKMRRVGKKMNKKRQPAKKIAYIELKKGTIDLFPKT